MYPSLLAIASTVVESKPPLRSTTALRFTTITQLYLPSSLRASHKCLCFKRIIFRARDSKVMKVVQPRQFAVKPFNRLFTLMGVSSTSSASSKDVSNSIDDVLVVHAD